MIGTLVRKELLTNLLTLRLGVAVIFSVVLSVLTTFIGTVDYARNVDVYEREIREYEEGLEEVAVYSQIAPRVVVPPQPLAILCRGVVSTAGQSMWIGLDQVPVSAWELAESFDSNFMRILVQIDFATVVALLLSFLAVVLGFDGICGERERGTLKQLLVNPVPRAHVVLAKLLGGMISLWIPFALALRPLPAHPGGPPRRAPGRRRLGAPGGLLRPLLPVPRPGLRPEPDGLLPGPGHGHGPDHLPLRLARGRRGIHQRPALGQPLRCEGPARGRVPRPEPPALERVRQDDGGVGGEEPFAAARLSQGPGARPRAALRPSRGIRVDAAEERLRHGQAPGAGRPPLPLPLGQLGAPGADELHRRRVVDPVALHQLPGALLPAGAHHPGRPLPPRGGGPGLPPHLDRVPARQGCLRQPPVVQRRSRGPGSR